ncbi:hypothetical protein [Methylorubrum thiocyanatum]|uniref:hypothetical protein n=1 Tax=Methylorubrum thiocyanatum TaxID=47958 RepID=UPI00398C42D2
MSSAALKTLAVKIVRRQIEDAKPVDVDAVASLVTFDVTDSGDILVTDDRGARRVGRADGFHMSLAERLDEIKAERPALFGKSAKPATDPSNPFVAGPNFSMTKQMLMWRADPEQAEYFAAEAGLTIKPLR